MRLKRWDQFPGYMRNEKVRPYYEMLKRRPGDLCAETGDGSSSRR